MRGAPRVVHTQGYKKLGFNRVDGAIVYREWAPAAQVCVLCLVACHSGVRGVLLPRASAPSDVMAAGVRAVWRLFRLEGGAARDRSSSATSCVNMRGCSTRTHAHTNV